MPMWSNGQREVRRGPGLPGQCHWTADEGFSWIKARIMGTYVALLQMRTRGTTGKITLYRWQESQSPTSTPIRQLYNVGDLDDMWVSEHGALLLQFHNGIELYQQGCAAKRVSLQTVISSCFSLDGHSICAWQRISDDYYWHVWDLNGVELRTQRWGWKSFPDTRPDSERCLMPFKHGQRWAACDIHGRLLLVDSSRERPILRRGSLYKFAIGHAMPDDRGLLIVKDRKPQTIALLTIQPTDLPTVRELGDIPEPLTVVPARCSTGVASLDVQSPAPYLFMLHQNGLLARRQLDS